MGMVRVLTTDVAQWRCTLITTLTREAAAWPRRAPLQAATGPPVGRRLATRRGVSGMCYSKARAGARRGGGGALLVVLAVVAAAAGLALLPVRGRARVSLGGTHARGAKGGMRWPAHMPSAHAQRAARDR